jgi:5-methylcytosine-specific restriction enzyme B
VNKEEIIKEIERLSGQSGSALVSKTRRGRQIKANALFEGSSSPSSPRTPIGVFFATDSTHLAHEGAVRRLTMDLPFPEAVITLGPTDKKCNVYGYDDTDIGVRGAEALGGEFHPVSRPDVAREARSPGNLSTDRLREALSINPNVILQGPPGTGKSTIAMELIKEHATSVDGYTSEKCRLSTVLRSYDSFETMITDTEGDLYKAPVIWEMIQLHPSYAYEDLIRRLVPSTKKGALQFRLEDQLLPKICRVSELRGDTPVFLILDEINRADLATVLGECLFAIDPSHRGEAVRLQYQDGVLPSTVKVPSNLHLIGTMNTADRSIALIDYAVRRRFSFVDVHADIDAIGAWYASDKRKAIIASQLFDSVNIGLPKSHMVGHSAFLVPSKPTTTWNERLASKFAFHIAPLLIEYRREGVRPPDPLHFRNQEIDLEAHEYDFEELKRQVLEAIADDTR